jgi:hypothetical protein
MHASVRRDIDPGSAATKKPVLADIFHTTAVTMGRLFGAYPGNASVLGESAVLFPCRIPAEITAYHDQLFASFQFIVVLNGQRIGACRLFPLDYRQIDPFVPYE